VFVEVRNGGVIVNVASVAATIAFPGIGIYSATKSGVDRLTRIAAAESGKLGYGVRVNCVYPGLVPTAMGVGLANDCARIGLFGSPEEAVGAVIGLTPSGRLGEVADMAAAVVFLASDAAAFINGVGLPVDGGMGM
jgi:3alpha(or 20beta)-hydroxysteroid dehydrogenase